MTKTLTNNIILIAFIALGAFTVFSYIFQLQAWAKDIYILDKQEKKLVGLSDMNKDLNIDFAKRNSSMNIDDYKESKNFVKAEQVKYIKIIEGSVAVK